MPSSLHPALCQRIGRLLLHEGVQACVLLQAINRASRSVQSILGFQEHVRFPELFVHAHYIHRGFCTLVHSFHMGLHMLLLLHAIIPCFTAWMLPCFYTFLHYHLYILQNVVFWQHYISGPSMISHNKIKESSMFTTSLKVSNPRRHWDIATYVLF